MFFKSTNKVLLVRMEEGKTFKASYLIKLQQEYKKQFKYLWYDHVVEAYILSNKSLSNLRPIKRFEPLEEPRPFGVQENLIDLYYTLTLKATLSKIIYY